MRALKRALAAADPIGTDEVAILSTSWIALAPGHHLRKQRCLACACMVGGKPHRVVTVLDWRVQGCSCGQVPSLTFMVCGLHAMPGDAELHRLAQARFRCHHPGRQP